MKSKISITALATIVALMICFYSATKVFAYDNPELLPDHPTPVIDLARALNAKERTNLESSLEEYQEKTGWKIRLLTQFEKSPGSAIKKFWDVDERSLVVIADPRGGNLLNFNVGEAYFALMPRLFWVELQTRFGNQFYVRDNGEDMAIINSIETVKSCLDKGGCEVVPGLPREQWIWTLSTSILGGLIAGIAAAPKHENKLIEWKWLLLISPLWFMLFGFFGLAPVITRTSELLPLFRNIMAFIGSSVSAYLLVGYSFNKNKNINS